MPEDTFERIIVVENEIRAKLADERQRVDSWLEGVKAELHTEYRQQLKSIKSDTQRKIQAEEEQVKDETRQLLEQMKSSIGELERIEDDVIRPILSKLLTRIVPRE